MSRLRLLVLQASRVPMYARDSVSSSARLLLSAHNISSRMGRCGTIDFREFVSGLALINSRSKEDREVLIFCLFDLDGTRVISRKEMMDTFKMLVQSNQRLAHRSMSSDQPISVDERTEVLAESMTNEIFEDCDLDNNGVLDLDEFR